MVGWSAFAGIGMNEVSSGLWLAGTETEASLSLHVVLETFSVEFVQGPSELPRQQTRSS